MGNNSDIVWHKVEDGLPELHDEHGVIECLAFVPDDVHGGWVVSCDFWNRHDDEEGPAFYRAEADKWDRQSQERVENATHWAKVEWPRENAVRVNQLYGELYAEQIAAKLAQKDAVIDSLRNQIERMGNRPAAQRELIARLKCENTEWSERDRKHRALIDELRKDLDTLSRRTDVSTNETTESSETRKAASADIQDCVNQLYDELQRRIAFVEGENERLERNNATLRNRIEQMANPPAGQRELEVENARLKRQLVDITSVEPLTGDALRGEWRRLLRESRTVQQPPLMDGMAAYVNAHIAGNVAFFRDQDAAHKRLIAEALGLKEELKERENVIETLRETISELDNDLERLRGESGADGAARDSVRPSSG